MVMQLLLEHLLLQVKNVCLPMEPVNINKFAFTFNQQPVYSKLKWGNIAF